MAGSRKYIMKYFNIRLLIRHKDFDPSLITSQLNLEPSISQMSGDNRYTPKGRKLDGQYTESRWNYTWEFKHNQRVAEELKSIVKKLLLHRDFMKNIINTKGSVELIINLPGSVNNGFCIDKEVIEVLNDIGIELGFEVFPEWTNDDGSHLKLV